MLFNFSTKRYVAFGFSGVLLLNGLLISTQLEAAECAVLKIQKNRSIGSTVTHNTCSNSTELSLDSVVEVKPGARLWLESVSGDQNAGNAQIICQNTSADAFSIKVGSAVSPWISSEGTSKCTSWANDRLECKSSEADNKAFFCAMSTVKKLSAQPAMERSTSLTLRGLKHESPKVATQSQIQHWTEALKPEINLCKKAFNEDPVLTLSWTVSPSGEASETSVNGRGVSKNLADCAIDVIENFSFPRLEQNALITQSF